MRLKESRIRGIVRGALRESAAAPAPINVDRIMPAFRALMQQARTQVERILYEDLAELEEKVSDPELTEDEAGGLFDAEYNDILRKLEESPPPAAQTADKIARSMMDGITRRIRGDAAVIPDEDEDDVSVITGNTRLLTYLCEIILRDIISTKSYAHLSTWLGYDDTPDEYLLSSLVHTVNTNVEDAVLDTAPAVMRALRTRSLIDRAQAGELIEDLAARLSSINLTGRDGTPMIILDLRVIAQSDIEAKARTARALLDRMPGGLE